MALDFHSLLITLNIYCALALSLAQHDALLGVRTIGKNPGFVDWAEPLRPPSLVRAFAFESWVGERALIALALQIFY